MSEDPVMAAVDGRRDVRAARARTEDEETFASMWAGAVKRTPEAPFLLFEAEGPVQAWTYAQFDLIVERTAATLHRHGVRSGTAVHLALPNCPAFVAVWLAVSRLGAWMVAADPRASSEEIADQFARTSPVLGIAASAGEDVYRAAMDAERVMPLLVIDDAGVSLVACRRGFTTVSGARRRDPVSQHAAPCRSRKATPRGSRQVREVAVVPSAMRAEPPVEPFRKLSRG